MNNGLNNNMHLLRIIQRLFTIQSEYNISIQKCPPQNLSFKKITNDLIGLYC